MCLPKRLGGDVVGNKGAALCVTCLAPVEKFYGED
jgi:hypothetical protein